MVNATTKGVKCKNCKHLLNEWCTLVTASPCPDTLRDCRYFCQKTNSHRIRAMSDEELAKYLQNLSTSECPFDESRCKYKLCDLCFLAWLKEPANEE